MKPSFLEELPNQQLLLPVMSDFAKSTVFTDKVKFKKSFSTKNYDFKLGPQAPKFSKLAETIEFNCYDKKLEQDIEFNALKCFKILKTKPAKILYILSMWEVIGKSPPRWAIPYLADLLKYKIYVHERKNADLYLHEYGEKSDTIINMFRTRDGYYYALPQNTDIKGLKRDPLQVCIGTGLPLHSGSFYTALLYSNDPYAMAGLQLHEVYSLNKLQQNRVHETLKIRFLELCNAVSDEDVTWSKPSEMARRKH